MAKPQAKVAAEGASYFSRLIFTWITPLIKLAHSRPLEHEDLFRLPEKDTVTSFDEECAKQWDIELKSDKPSFGKALWRTLRGDMIKAALFHSMFVASTMIGPEILRQILIAIFAGNSRTGYGLATALFFNYILGAMYQYRSLELNQKAGYKARGATVLILYRKALRLRQDAASNEVSKSLDITNLVANDGSRIADVLPVVNMGLFSPIQIVIVLAMLGRLLGIYALVAMLILFLNVPINIFFSKYMGRVKRRMSSLTDARVALTKEILTAIRIVKMYAWEMPFSQKIESLRNAEINELRYVSLARAGIFVVTLCTPVLVSAAVFASYAAGEGSLDVATIFASLAYINALRVPMTGLPNLLTQLSLLSVSLDRVQEFLLLRESALSVESSPSSSSSASSEEPKQEKEQEVSAGGILLKNATFGWMIVEREKACAGKKGGKKGEIAAAAEKPKPEEGEKEVAQPSDVRVKIVDMKPAGGGKNVPKKTLLVVRDANLFIPGLKDRCGDASSSSSNGLLIFVVGMVGSGKSTLILGLLGETAVRSGTAKLGGSVGYAGQVPFIVNASIRDNILFGAPYDEQKYKKVLEACALEHDLSLMPSGDLTEVGERGLTLSGGQKARVGLARAAYSKSDTVILDDVLSAVDAHVADHLMKQCICGLMKNDGKTVLMASNQVQFCDQADKILSIDGSTGSLVEITASEAMAVLQTSGSVSNLEAAGEQEAAEAATATELPKNKETKEQSKAKVVELVEPSSPPPPASPSSPDAKSLSVDKGKVISKETKAEGTVTWRTYKEYFMGGGGSHAILFVFFVFMYLAENGFNSGTNVWLSIWTNESRAAAATSSSFDNIWYLSIYIGISCACLFFAIIRGLSSVTLFNKSSRHLHSGLLRSLLSAPISFYDATPLGRILNRCAKDIDSVDVQMPTSFQMAASGLLIILSYAAAVAAFLPLVLVFFFPIALIYVHVRNFYANSVREVQRLESISRSPVLHSLGETLSGLPTVRAFTRQSYFLQQMAHAVNENMRAQVTLTQLRIWLIVRLDTLSYLILYASALLVVGSNLSQGSAGLTLSYILNICSLLKMASIQSADFESKLTSVERVVEYSMLEAEGCSMALKKAVINPPPENWPSQGEIQFKNVVMRYRPTLDPVLRNVSFNVPAGTSLAIVGRSGAGKSSIVQALLRLVESESGEILIDGVDVQTLRLFDLRSRGLAVIPQEPVLLSGTIRSNLDPFNQFGDREIWRALEVTRLKERVEAIPNKLLGIIAEGGSNLSVGERQLFCIARAVLRDPKVIVLDEASASVDTETDSQIQETIRQSFSGRTIICIAHRLSTIIDFNSVLVMSNGEVVEHGTPAELLRKEEGYFAALVDRTGADSSKMLRSMAVEAESRQMQQQPQPAGVQPLPAVAAEGSSARQE